MSSNIIFKIIRGESLFFHPAFTPNSQSQARSELTLPKETQHP